MALDKLMIVVGARPNYMKIAPLYWHGFRNVKPILVDSGQHSDPAMAARFRDEFGIPDPDYTLPKAECWTLGEGLLGFRSAITLLRPDRVLVVGDVNSSVAAAMAAAASGIPTTHIEAGYRSWDSAMPEEVNRIMIDRLADTLYAPTQTAMDNLSAGDCAGNAALVGNAMIDVLDSKREVARLFDLDSVVWRHSIRAPMPLSSTFALMTIHRPSNVDLDADFQRIVSLVRSLSESIQVVWVTHHRMLNKLAARHTEAKELADLCSGGQLVMLSPVGYTEMLALNAACACLLTDSGGMQEEACVLGTPTVVMRSTTERVDMDGTPLGPCKLASASPLEDALTAMTADRAPHRPSLWDGHTAGRIMDDARW